MLSELRLNVRSCKVSILLILYNFKIFNLQDIFELNKVVSVNFLKDKILNPFILFAQFGNIKKVGFLHVILFLTIVTGFPNGKEKVPHGSGV